MPRSRLPPNNKFAESHSIYYRRTGSDHLSLPTSSNGATVSVAAARKRQE